MSVENENKPRSSFFSDEEPEPILDQLPNYKAVAPSAIVSVILGVLSALSFTDLIFAVIGVGGVVAGMLALRKIKRLPDIWTGRVWAERGIGLSLLFTLGAFTIFLTQTFLRDAAARGFAREYAQIVSTKSYDDVLFYHGSPEGRAGKPAAQVVDEMRKSNPNPQMFDMTAKPVRDVKELLKAPGQTFAYETMEFTGSDGFRVVGRARYKLEGPGNAEFPAKENHALVRFRGVPKGRAYEWMIDEFVFPYKPNSKQYDY